MGQELRRIQRRRRAIQAIDKLVERAADCLIIHYSCESFYDRADGRTPRVTSIAVRNFDSGQTESFSIHKVAELQRMPPDQIQDNHDALEREMLQEFFEYLNSHRALSWIHWNMRDINFGFQALEHRFRVLGGQPSVLPEDKKFDLSRALIDIYGVKYIGHPRLTRLLETNHITNRDFLTGQDEADAFERREYVRLHQSTLRKVDVLANILGRTADGSLQTDSKWYHRSGFHPRVMVELLREHWIVGGLGLIALIGALLRLFGIVG